MSAYESIGLLAHLTAEEKAAVWEQVASADIDSYHAILAAIPGVVALVQWEIDNFENPYEEATLALARASRGVFEPSHICDTSIEEKETVQYGFESNGKMYEKELEGSGYLQDDFMKLVGKAIADTGSDGRFYFCGDDGVQYAYIFLTPEQYTFLKTRQPGLMLRKEQY